MCGSRARRPSTGIGWSGWGSATKRDRGTQLRRRQTTARPPLCQDARLQKVQQQCLLAATAQNIKKIALLISRMGPDTPSSTLYRLLTAYRDRLQRLHQLIAAPPNFA